MGISSIGIRRRLRHGNTDGSAECNTGRNTDRNTDGGTEDGDPEQWLEPDETGHGGVLC